MTLELETELGSIFPRVNIIDDDSLLKGINSLVKNAGLPVVSLDRCYVDENSPNLCGFLDVSRCVNEKFEQLGVNGRDACTVGSQMDKLVSKLGPNRRIAIVDDVLFAGDTHTYVSKMFKERGITVAEVIVGVSIGEGKSILENNGIKVSALLSYDTVVDEICERDFSAGVPFSGRTVKVGEEIYGAPYFYPFGTPETWASIPKDRAGHFSEFCLESSIKLWSNIEKRSDRPISTDEVPKKIFGLEKNKSIVEALKSVRCRLG
jgi:hypothetical protein